MNQISVSSIFNIVYSKKIDEVVHRLRTTDCVHCEIKKLSSENIIKDSEIVEFSIREEGH
jgi:hypothetical protein